MILQSFDALDLVSVLGSIVLLLYFLPLLSRVFVVVVVVVINVFPVVNLFERFAGCD